MILCDCVGAVLLNGSKTKYIQLGASENGDAPKWSNLGMVEAGWKKYCIGLRQSGNMMLDLWIWSILFQDKPRSRYVHVQMYVCVSLSGWEEKWAPGGMPQHTTMRVVLSAVVLARSHICSGWRLKKSFPLSCAGHACCYPVCFAHWPAGWCRCRTKCHLLGHCALSHLLDTVIYPYW